MANKSDVELLLGLYHDLLDLYKSNDKQIRELLDLQKNNSGLISNLTYIEKSNVNLIMLLFDEIRDLKGRIKELEDNV